MFFFQTNFNELRNEPNNLDSAAHVVDGGMLLHKVMWKAEEKVDDIVSKYVNYVSYHFSKKVKATVVFNGYDNVNPENSTKTSERSRRSAREKGSTFIVKKGSTIKLSQEKFLSVDENKAPLITLLIAALKAKGFSAQQAIEDADR